MAPTYLVVLFRHIRSRYRHLVAQWGSPRRLAALRTLRTLLRDPRARTRLLRRFSRSWAAVACGVVGVVGLGVVSSTLTSPPTKAHHALVAPGAAPTSVPAASAVAPSERPGASAVPTYWEVASDGGVFAFGGSAFYGSMGGHALSAPVVGMAATPDRHGYWEVASDGGVFAFGDARFLGSEGGRPLAAPVVGTTAATQAGAKGALGYWEVASDGGVFAFGGAAFYGSMGGHALSAPVVGIAATPDGRGYWEVASDGGVFAFGDATFLGSEGGHPLSAPVVGIAATPDGHGYWEVASDGGVFAFGDARFHGSMGGKVLGKPVTAMSVTPDGGGYWEVAADGGVFSFGDTGFYGSMGSLPLGAPVTGIVQTKGTGAFTEVSAPGYASGSYGFDISLYQDNAACNGSLPGPHTIGVVEVTGSANGNPNPCLAHEAAWAGAGLNLYVFLSGGTSSVDAPGCNHDPSCNWGYSAGTYAMDVAAASGVPTKVTWWLDIEGAGTYWGSDTAANDRVIAGAAQALRTRGAPSVGVYTSPQGWAGVAGSWQPHVPLWIAWYTGNPVGNCGSAVAEAAAGGDLLPTGRVVMTQYSDGGGSVDLDYAC